MKLLPVWVLAGGLLLTACGGKEPIEDYDHEPNPELEDRINSMMNEEEVDKTPVVVSWDDLKSGDLKDGQVVIIKGYIERLATSITTYSDDRFYFHLLSRRNEDGYHATVRLPIGRTRNKIKSLPDSFTQEDLVVTTKNSNKAGVAAYVEVIGEYSESIFPESGCEIDMMEVRLLDESFDATVLDEAVELTDEVVKKPSPEPIYAYMDVEITMDMNFTVLDMYYIGVTPISNSSVKKIKVDIGYWPGTVAKANNGGLYLIDLDGEAVVKGDKARVYGTYEFDKTDGKGDFNVEEVVKL